ncbi:MAG: 1-(5-phosphoribosyl)-5-[(5-phosphoribosylamino)methylideneamino]imidazole-4-carboxamide isomerase [Candidatus Bathyarchaeia archaeon]
MDVIPAVDLMNGKVVRLVRGDPKLVTSYEHLGDPVSVAKKWEKEGASFVHVVDLDASLGVGDNLKIIESIVNALKINIQVGGGIKTLNLARKLLNLGVNRCILGSIAFSKPSVVKTLLNEYGEKRILVALDNINGMVLIRGWKASAKITTLDAITKFSKIGVKFFLVTSVVRDGTLSGPDFESLVQICKKGVNIIAAGGVGCLDDIVALKSLGINAVVVGKALYEGRFSLSEALRTARDS